MLALRGDGDGGTFPLPFLFLPFDDDEVDWEVAAFLDGRGILCRLTGGRQQTREENSRQTAASSGGQPASHWTFPCRSQLNS